jgi:signal transduction histidine kinase
VANAAGNNDATQSPSQQSQQARGQQEFVARSQNSANASSYELGANRKQMAAGGRVREGLLRPVWIEGKLVLARRVAINDQDYVQGCWLNLEAIRQTLLESIKDLLPAASLEAASFDDPEKQPRLLAAIPLKLVSGAVATEGSQGVSPVRMALGIAWGCLLLGSVSVAMLLAGALRLSERRGAFVSAVTHELRTPLTTVSMYAEMLQEGMVSDEGTRQQYLATLRAEADRLGHLVENVLAYSRIEKGRAEGRIQTIGLGELVASAKQRLVQRAEQAQMVLVIRVPDDVAATMVRADTSAVEQILFNLVDNAAKYAASGAGRRIEMEASVDDGVARLMVRDQGPGITAAEAKRLFRPFSKSARDAANSAPGVGLGLALSRRLAREMKGDLVLQRDRGEGARFLLTLPRG